MRNRSEEENTEFIEKLISLNRVAKVVKGGRRFAFAALVVIGNKNGRVGYGYGKAGDVAEAIRKANERAKRNMVDVRLHQRTIPHQVIGKYKSSQLIMLPAAPGTGVIAGGPVRAIMEAAGIQDVRSKSHGSRNALTLLKATFNGIEQLLKPSEIAARRGKTVPEIMR